MEVIKRVYWHQCIGGTHDRLPRIHLWEMPVHVGPTGVAQLLCTITAENTTNEFNVRIRTQI